ncbi:CGNR zinc finger domain-containing protein [Streptosporangium sp. OZ121]|uniref:CGNR zinc finger domain-containing protein n=1 Tax=Streptosporangium sp. OZ121 TaxID=3444183 RepID=UPI003F7B020B
MRVERLEGGGAPMLGEPLPIELANASYAVRGTLVDGLQRVEHVAAWFRDQRDRFAVPFDDRDLLSVTAEDLAATRALRDAVRTLIKAAVQRAEMPPGTTGAVGVAETAAAVEVINRQVRVVPRWRELSWGEGPQALARSSADLMATARAEIAQQAVDLLGGSDIALLKACHAPGCVLYFLKDHPRREWCSAACGNRARAARHYKNVKQTR